MKKVVLNITQYDPSIAFSEIKGRSETVPNEATSLHELVVRALRGAQLPALAQEIETGEDEDFEDAFEPGKDLSDYIDNLSYIEKQSDLIERAKEAALREKRENKAEKEQESIKDPLEEQSV